MSFERTLGDFWGTRLDEWPVLERSEGSVVRRGELLLPEAERPSLKARRAFDFEGPCPSSSPSQKALFCFGGLGARLPKREGFALTATSLRTGQKGRSESEKEHFSVTTR